MIHLKQFGVSEHIGIKTCTFHVAWLSQCETRYLSIMSETTAEFDTAKNFGQLSVSWKAGHPLAWRGGPLAGGGCGKSAVG